MSYPKLAVAIATALATSVANAADVTREVLVEDTALTEPGVDRLTTEALTGGISADGGELLRGVTGVSGVRMGGHGIDPIIRGQTQTQLNILLDGAYLHGGCPNRMDPPSSYASVETYDKVTVLKGNQSVIYGGGGSGGTVLFERETPRLAEGENLRGKLGASYGSNANEKDVFADVTAGSTQGFARAIVEGKKADNYEDGDGNEVRSAYKNRSASAILGYTPDDNTRLELGLEANRGEDILFFGGMDSPYSDSDTLRLRYKQQAMQGLFSAVNAEVYQSKVEHLMDNYSLRDLSGTMRMKVPSDSTTRGGRISGDIRQGAHLWTLGLDHQFNNRDAVISSQMQMMGMWGPWMESNFLWPDVDIKQTGLFAEMLRPLSAQSEIKLGLRYDRVEAVAHKANLDPMAMGDQTHNNLYLSKYGVGADTHKENNVGGFVRYSRDIGNNGSWFMNLSRSVRTADATERYISNKTTSAMMDWVGNPQLDPEIHHQVEFGAERSSSGSGVGGSVYYSKIADYILKQSGMNGTLYHNVDAVIYGAEVESSRTLTQSWSTGAKLAYVRGVNTTDDKPLPQIAPLELTVNLDYTRSDWSVGGRVRGVNQQTQTDLAGGDVNSVTHGYAVADLYASMHVGKQAEVKLGIDNLFDLTYVDHLTREDAFTGASLAANEPGRNVWLQGVFKF